MLDSIGLAMGPLAWPPFAPAPPFSLQAAALHGLAQARLLSPAFLSYTRSLAVYRNFPEHLLYFVRNYKCLGHLLQAQRADLLHRCLFSEVGYRSTQDIPAAPYIRAASLYSHIDNKKELLWSTTVRVVDEFDRLCRLNQIRVG